MDNRATRLEPPKWGVFQLSLSYSKKKKRVPNPKELERNHQLLLWLR